MIKLRCAAIQTSYEKCTVFLLVWQILPFLTHPKMEANCALLNT